VEVDGMYVGGYVKPANHKENRRDRRLVANQNGNRRVGIVMRERQGKTLMKRWSLGTYHGLRRQHVDAYLNEFVFRYNRRRLRHLLRADPRSRRSAPADDILGHHEGSEAAAPDAAHSHTAPTATRDHRAA
jgi:hypothetical protein